MVPGPLAAVLLGVAAEHAFSLDVPHVVMPENLFASGSWLFDPELLLSGKIWTVAIELALIASTESLLCAAALDQLHRGPKAILNRELAAQGLGNALCGLLGALPLTGVIVRSSVNIDSGGKTRSSAIFHGIWLLLIALFYPAVFRSVPIASLAAILVVTGVKLVNFGEALKTLRHGRLEFGIYAITIATIVGYNLLGGVILGMVLSAVKLLVELTHFSFRVEQEDAEGDAAIRLEFHGVASFLRLPAFLEALDKVPPGSPVAVSSQLRWIDRTCKDYFHTWASRHTDTGGTIRGHLFPER
jgi:MFS superfamily sulfate permease-like transporter